jgi:hypothetical protein
MPQYCVSFFNNLLNSNGMPFKCMQRTVTVREAQDAEAASEKAKRAFERLENVPNWKCRAQFFEVDITSQRSLRPGGVSRRRTKPAANPDRPDNHTHI